MMTAHKGWARKHLGTAGKLQGEKQPRKSTHLAWGTTGSLLCVAPAEGSMPPQAPDIANGRGVSERERQF